MHIPISFVIVHLNIKIDKKKRQIISNKITTEHTIPSAKTGTDIDFISVTKSQGRGNLKQKISFQSVAVTVLLHLTSYRKLSIIAQKVLTQLLH